MFASALGENQAGSNTISSIQASIAVTNNATCSFLSNIVRRCGQWLWFDLMGLQHSRTTPEKRDLQQSENYEVVLAGPAIPVECSVSGRPISCKLALGCGCYWGTEKFVRKDFQRRFPGSIRYAKVGFMSPHEQPRLEKPTYSQVCGWQNNHCKNKIDSSDERDDDERKNELPKGHVEVLYIELNEPEKHFEELCLFFFCFHDPTQRNRQGNDRGFQYSSWIFCDDQLQKQIAQRVRWELQAALDWKKSAVLKAYQNRIVCTNLAALHEFTEGPTHHQEYLTKKPDGYCNHRVRMKEWYTLQKKQLLDAGSV